jgi:hypothetical protein
MLLIKRIAYNLLIRITGKCTFCDSPLPPHPVNEEFCSIDCAAYQQEVDAEEQAMYEKEMDEAEAEANDPGPPKDEDYDRNEMEIELMDDEEMDDHDPFEEDVKDECHEGNGGPTTIAYRDESTGKMMFHKDAHSFDVEARYGGIG